MNNSTTSTSAQNTTNTMLIVVSSIVVAVIGCSTILLNGTVCFIIFLYGKLRNRKELVVILGLAFAEVIQGLSNVSTAIKFLFQISSLLPPETLKPQDCVKEFNVASSIVSLPLVSLMLLVVSIDRLISMWNMKSYLEVSKKYYLTIVLGVPVIVSLFMYVGAWYSLNDEKEGYSVQAVQCGLFVTILPKFMFGIVTFGSFSFIFASVLVYIIVIMVYRRRIHITQQGTIQTQERQQIVLTKTYGLMCISTVLLDVIPGSTAIYFGVFFDGEQSVAANAVYISRTFGSSFFLINMVIYLSRSGPARTQLLLLLRKLRCDQSKPTAPQPAVTNASAPRLRDLSQINSNTSSMRRIPVPNYVSKCILNIDDQETATQATFRVLFNDPLMGSVLPTSAKYSTELNFNSATTTLAAEENFVNKATLPLNAGQLHATSSKQVVRNHLPEIE